MRLSFLSGVLLYFIGVAGTAVAESMVTLAPSDMHEEHQVIVLIEARRFEPSRIVLQSGHKTKLVLLNQDAELHAFVPGALFVGVHLNISGNGAPEFGDAGFRRVIIPSAGRTEIRFVPERKGIYPVLCDMPGHEMKATIVIE
jgi:uncharacterized cupredoxin-like copper-binding protein